MHKRHGLQWMKLSVLLPVFFLVNVVNLRAQVLQRDSIVGVWICRSATFADNIKISKEELEALITLKSIIINSKFIFKENG
jgi:hypothetical protein